MKRLLLSILMAISLLNSSVYGAYEIRNDQVQEKQQSSSTSSLVNDIKILKEYIKNIPTRLKQAKDDLGNANRSLENIEESIVKHLGVNKIYATTTSSNFKRLYDDNYKKHAIGQKLSQYKTDILKIIEDVEKILAEAEDDSANVAEFRNMLSSLESLKRLNDGGIK